MHIKIEDQETGHESILCIDRSAKTAQILRLVPGHENLLAQVAQSVGATYLTVVATKCPTGFVPSAAGSLYVKEL